MGIMAGEQFRFVCLNCGMYLDQKQCKMKCPRCGYFEDCSDGGNDRPNFEILKDASHG